MSLEEAQERHRTIGRNDDCPCGSQKKYKRCHKTDDDATISAELKRLGDAAAAEAAALAAAEQKESESGEKGTSAGPGKSKVTAPKKKIIAGASGSRAGGKTDGGRPGAKAQSLPRRGAV